MRRKLKCVPKRRFWTGFMGGLFALLVVHALTPLDAKTNHDLVLYWHGNRSEKKVALTFDDGPNEPYTSQILNILKENNTRATFFLVGKNVEAFPESARAILRA